jgi:hypothetical protein
LGRLAGVCGLDSTGSGYGLVAGCCESGDEPLGSGATELVSFSMIINLLFDSTLAKCR